MWTTYGIMAMLMLAGMLLLIKYAGLSWNDNTGMLFVLSLGLLICSSTHLLVTRHVWQPKWTAIGIVAVAALLSYIGNLCYIKAVTLAPNPGYPVAIEGNKAVLVLIASCLLFGAEFSIGKLIGILLCLAGVFFIAR